MDQIGDCTTCKFDKETMNCGQGHMREWRHEKCVPIQDCHAYKEKGVCPCRYLRFSQATTDTLDITCKKCGEKLVGTKPILERECVCSTIIIFGDPTSSIYFDLICKRCGKKKELSR